MNRFAEPTWRIWVYRSIPEHYIWKISEKSSTLHFANNKTADQRNCSSYTGI
jgi:hypothetical protein